MSKHNHHYTNITRSIAKAQPQVWMIAGGVLLGMIILGCLILAVWPKSFTARTTIEFQKQWESPSESNDFGTRTFFNTQVELIRSRAFLKKLANSDELKSAWDVPFEKAGNALLRSIKVSHRQNTNFIDIDFATNNALESVRLADVIGEFYLDHWRSTQAERYDEIIGEAKAGNPPEFLQLLGVEKMRVVSAARISTYASETRPVKAPNLLGGLLFVLFGAIVTAAIAVYVLTRSVDTREKIGEITEVVNPPNLTLLTKTEHEEAATHAEPFHEIRKNILSHFPKPEGVTIVSVSCFEDEDPAPVSADLAKTLAKGGNSVLLIEGNLRQPVIHETFDASPSPGVTDYMIDEMALEAAVWNTRFDNLWIMPGGKPHDSPSELLGSIRMEELVYDAKRRFDFVIFNGGSLRSAVDSLILVGESDMTFLSTEAGTAQGEVLARTRYAIEQAGGTFSGLILTQVEPEQLDEVENGAEEEEPKMSA